MHLAAATSSTLCARAAMVSGDKQHLTTVTAYTVDHMAVLHCMPSRPATQRQHASLSLSITSHVCICHVTGTIFVYGQTGAGKTHTIEQMTQRVLQQLHARAAADESREYAMFVSVIELYNEVLRDLVSGKNDLQLRNPGGGIVVDGLVEKVGLGTISYRRSRWMSISSSFALYCIIQINML